MNEECEYIDHLINDSWIDMELDSWGDSIYKKKQ